MLHVVKLVKYGNDQKDSFCEFDSKETLLPFEKCCQGILPLHITGKK